MEYSGILKMNEVYSFAGTCVLTYEQMCYTPQLLLTHRFEIVFLFHWSQKICLKETKLIYAEVKNYVQNNYIVHLWKIEGPYKNSHFGEKRRLPCGSFHQLHRNIYRGGGGGVICLMGKGLINQLAHSDILPAMSPIAKMSREG